MAGGTTFQITYQGGDGNDAVLTAIDPAAPSLNGTPAADTFLVKRNEANVEVYLAGNLIDSRPLASIAGGLTIDGLGGNDTLTVDFSGGDPIPASGLIYHGGVQSGAPGDRLIITGNLTPFASQVFTFTGQDSQGADNGFDGNVDLDGSVILFTGLEPISGGDALNTTCNLPDGVANAATLQDHAAPGRLAIVGTTFADTDFLNPSVSLSIHGGNMADTITVDAVDAAFRASLIVDSHGGTDAIHLNSDLTLGSATSAGNLTLTAESIQVAASSIRTNAGAHAGTADFHGPVTLSAHLAIDTDASGSDGNVNFHGTLDGGQTLTLATGTGSFAATSAVGATTALASIAIHSAADATFLSTVRTTGDVTQATGTGTTTLNGTSGTGVGGSLSITASAIVLDSATVLTVGTVNLNAQDAISVSAGAGLNAGASTITILANQDGTGADSFTQAEGTTIQTTNATADAVVITVGGTGSAAIAALQAGTAGRVTITAGGAIPDNNAAARNITAGATVLTAGGGAVGDPVDPLETAVGHLEGAAGGGFWLTNAGNLRIGGIFAANDPYGVSAGGEIVITALGALDVAENVISSGGSVLLTASDSASPGEDLTVPLRCFGQEP
jgi:hypothetical protein